MDIASLAVGIFALLLAIIPSFSVTQVLGGVLSIVAVVLAVLGRRRLIYKHQSRGIATAGLVLGVLGLMLNSAVFISCQLCQGRVREGLRQVGEEVRRELDREISPRPAEQPAPRAVEVPPAPESEQP